MKNVVNIAMIALVLASCQKDSIHPNSPGTTGEPTIENCLGKAKAGDLRVWYDNGGSDYGCSGSGGNCLPDIIVTPSLAAPLKEIHDAIAHDPRAIPAIFEKHRKLLHDLFDMKIIQSVIKGATEIDDRVAADNSTHYLVFMSKKSGEVIAVYPLLRSLGGSYRVWYDNGGTDYGCKGSGGNCLPDVIVTAKLAPTINNVFAVLNSGNPKAISNVLVKNRDELSEVISPKLIDGVIRGIINLEARGKQDSDFRFLIFSSPESGEIEAVYPFVK